jgi:hypothetical protein
MKIACSQHLDIMQEFKNSASHEKTEGCKKTADMILETVRKGANACASLYTSQSISTGTPTSTSDKPLCDSTQSRSITVTPESPQIDSLQSNVGAVTSNMASQEIDAALKAYSELVPAVEKLNKENACKIDLGGLKDFTDSMSDELQIARFYADPANRKKPAYNALTPNGGTPTQENKGGLAQALQERLAANTAVGASADTNGGNGSNNDSVDGQGFRLSTRGQGIHFGARGIFGGTDYNRDDSNVASGEPQNPTNPNGVSRDSSGAPSPSMSLATGRQTEGLRPNLGQRPEEGLRPNTGDGNGLRVTANDSNDSSGSPSTPNLSLQTPGQATGTTTPTRPAAPSPQAPPGMTFPHGNLPDGSTGFVYEDPQQNGKNLIGIVKRDEQGNMKQFAYIASPEALARAKANPEAFQQELKNAQQYQRPTYSPEEDALDRGRDLFHSLENGGARNGTSNRPRVASRSRSTSSSSTKGRNLGSANRNARSRRAAENKAADSTPAAQTDSLYISDELLKGPTNAGKSHYFMIKSKDPKGSDYVGRTVQINGYTRVQFYKVQSGSTPKASDEESLRNAFTRAGTTKGAYATNSDVPIGVSGGHVDQAIRSAIYPITPNRSRKEQTRPAGQNAKSPPPPEGRQSWGDEGE